MIKEQIRETGTQLKKDLGQARAVLPEYVKKASQDILQNMHDKEKQSHPQMDGLFLSSVHYLTVNYFKKIGKFCLYLLAYLAFCQILYPQASLVFAVSGLISLAILSSAIAFFEVLIHRIIGFFSKRQRVHQAQVQEAKQENQD